MSTYEITDTAKRELLAVLDYIEQEHGPARADGVQQEFLDTFRLIASAPGIGVVKPTITGPQTRWWFMHRYAILYTTAWARRYTS